MVLRKLKERLFKRHDQFDYQAFGIDEFWYLKKTIVMLVSFYMEVNGLFDKGDPVETFSKLYANYLKFIVNNGLAIGKIKYVNVIDEHEERDYWEGAVDLHRARFRREDLLNYIEQNNLIQIDINRLKKFIYCEELPNIPVDASEPLVSKETTSEASSLSSFEQEGSNFADQKVDSEFGIEMPKCNNKYIFEKTNKGWSLQFDDAVLHGVKDLLGMTYLKLLLQHPGEKISVFNLQRMAGCCNSDVLHDDTQYYYEENEDSSYTSGPSAWEGLDFHAKTDYHGRLEKIKIEVKDARIRKDQKKIDVLIAEAEFIERELQDNQGKSKDPQAEKNRKRVCNAITDAIDKIKKLEDAYNYNDRPISGHLKRNIKKGVCCSYSIEPNKLPKWKF